MPGQSGKARSRLPRPAIAKQPRHRHLQRIVRPHRMAVEQPLRRIARMRLRQAVRILLGGDFLPVSEVERDFDDCPFRDVELAVDLRTASSNSPDSQKHQIAGRTRIARYNWANIAIEDLTGIQGARHYSHELNCDSPLPPCGHTLKPSHFRAILGPINNTFATSVWHGRFYGALKSSPSFFIVPDFPVKPPPAIIIPGFQALCRCRVFYQDAPAWTSIVITVSGFPNCPFCPTSTTGFSRSATPFSTAVLSSDASKPANTCSNVGCC